jgi:GntR family transcriptional regulator
VTRSVTRGLAGIAGGGVEAEDGGARRSPAAYPVDRPAGDQRNSVRKVQADEGVAAALAIEPDAWVNERARLVKDGDDPTHTLTSYYRPEDVEGTRLVDPSPGPATRGGGFAVLTLQGLEPDRITERIHSRMPTQAEAETLALPAGEPVMVLERQTFTAKGRAIEFARGVHAASRFAWTYSFQIPD